ncbi:MAG: 3-deoxy-8-phosphooctulonate synthase [Elusimicrobiota bacterium]
MKNLSIGNLEIGETGKPLFIAGPCVIENYKMLEKTAVYLKNLSVEKDFKFVLKVSYDKANRTSGDSFRGPGLKKGLKLVKRIKKKLDVPVLMDVHCSQQIKEAGKVADCLQIPAFLCRQTDLIVEAGRTGLPVNIKKGQFMQPDAMKFQAEKALGGGSGGVLLTERGTFFGYGDLIVDMRGIVRMREDGFLVLFDATHSQQKPAGADRETGGNRKYVIPMVKAALAAGARGIYCEVHPEPSKARSDRETQLNFEQFKKLVNEVSRM